MKLKFFSDSRQDEFVANILDFKRSGYCIDIGSQHSSISNNTYFFQKFDWTSITIECESFYNDTYISRKKNFHLNEDALTVNYKKIFEEHKFPKNIDYLSLDVDTLSLDVLKILPLKEYRFKVITIEHDEYLYGDKYKLPQREILNSYGYTLVCSNVYVEQPGFEGRTCAFEDWWVDLNQFDEELIKKIKCDRQYPLHIINNLKNSKPKQTDQMNVTLYAICKNEEKNVEKFIENSKKFFHTVVVDTGSTDNTVQLLRDAGVEVYEHLQSKDQFDFSTARNQALSYVKTDWAFSLDFNEDIGDFFPEGFSVIEKDFTVFKHLRFDDNGNEEPVQSNEVHVRFHRTQNYKWSNAVHEIPVFVPTENYQEEVSVDTTIKITKKINKTLSKELFYLGICEREYNKDPLNTYYIWFIFNHYFNFANYSKALEYGQEYLNKSKSYFDTFRISVFIRCSICLFELKDISKGVNYSFHALSEAMNMGEPYLSQAFIHLNQISKILNNPNITIFATGFNSDTLQSQDRINSINHLYFELNKQQ